LLAQLRLELAFLDLGLLALADVGRDRDRVAMLAALLIAEPAVDLDRRDADGVPP
jgi:hypothetical protein